MKMEKSSQRSFRWLLAIVILLAVIVAVSAICSGMISNMEAEYQRKAVEEVRAENEQRRVDYENRLAAYNAKITAGASAGTTGQWPVPTGTGWEVLDVSAFPLEAESSVFYSQAQLDSGSMVLINEWHAQPVGFEPAALESIARRSRFTIPTRDNSVMLFPIATDQLMTALQDAKTIGLQYYEAIVGYRDYQTQSDLWDKAYTANLKRYYANQVLDMTKRSTSYPGTSDHHSGYTFQLRLYSSDNPEVIKQDFQASAQGLWMMENGWKYGIIFRFPQDKAYITGIHVSVNTFRYVGKANAAAMKHLDLCMEEYIAYLQEHPHLVIYQDGRLAYEIYRYEADTAEGYSVGAPLQYREMDVSSDNCGGVIATFTY